MTDELKQWEYDRGYEKGRADAITELLETQKYDELSQKIAIDILERGIAKGKSDGAREFAEWLCGKYSRMKQDSIGFEKFQNIYWKSIDEVLAEWQKEAENDNNGVN